MLFGLPVKLQQVTLEEVRMERDQLRLEKESIMDQVMEKVQCCYCVKCNRGPPALCHGYAPMFPRHTSWKWYYRLVP